MSVDAQHVRRLLDGDDLRWLIDRTRRRLERGQPLDGSVVLLHATPAQRRAVEGLLGRPMAPGQALSVRLSVLQATLVRAGAAPDLKSAVELLTGPVLDRVTARTELERAWDDAICAYRGTSTAPTGAGAMVDGGPLDRSSAPIGPE